MSWIQIIEEAESTGKLKEVYEEIEKKRGKISNIMKIHILNPDAMKKHMDLYLSIMFGSSDLTREDRELIGVVVSTLNCCEYCINHHAEALNHYWNNNKKIQELIKDYQSVDLPDKRRHMLDYVYKLTKTPYEIKNADVETLRKSGFSDENILNINLITSYFNFVNRIALGLGVGFSNEEMTGYNY